MAGDQQKFQVAMTHAERFRQQQNWNDAIKAYRFALAEFPNSEDAIVGFGRATLAAGHPEHAWKAFHQVLRINPANTDALESVADIQTQMGQAGGAAQTYNRLGAHQAKNGQLEAAVEAWRAATELVPNYAEAHNNLAQALYRIGQPRLAARQLLTLAGLYQAQGQINSAGQIVNQLGQILPNDPGVLKARQALQAGRPLSVDLISETEFVDVPALLVPDDEPVLLQPDPQPESDEPTHLLTPDEPQAEPTPDDDADDLLGYFDDDDEDELEAEVAPPPEEEDIFGFGDLDTAAPQAETLVSKAQQEALSELANVIFEDDPSGPDRFLGSDGVELSRMEVSMMIIQAIDLQTREDYDQAIERYSRVVKANAGRPALYFNLGLLYQEQQNYNDAIKVLRLASQSPKFRTSAQFVLGQMYYAVQDYDQAMHQIAQMLKPIDVATVSSEQADALELKYDNLSDEYAAKDDPAAIEAFFQAVEQFFGHTDWQERVRKARQRLDSVSDEDEVMSLADFLETSQTEVIITALATTNEYLKEGLIRSAGEECYRAIERAPQYLPLHARLADIMLKQQLTDAAVEKYLSIAKVYETRRQPEQAMGVFQKILRVAPMDVTVRSKLIDIHMSRRKYNKALEQYLLLADSYYQLAQSNTALEKYNEALNLSKQVEDGTMWQVKILNQLGDIYNQRFDWSKAANYLEQAYQLEPDDEQTAQNLIDLYFKQSKASQAIKILDGWLKTKQRREPTKAIQFLRELVAVYDDNVFLRQRLAIAYAQAGRKLEAISEYDTLGEIQLNQGHPQQAAQTIQAILRLGPDDRAGYEELLQQIQSGALA